jgi:hypothetical protein
MWEAQRATWTAVRAVAVVVPVVAEAVLVAVAEAVPPEVPVVVPVVVSVWWVWPGSQTVRCRVAEGWRGTAGRPRYCACCLRTQGRWQVARRLSGAVPARIGGAEPPDGACTRRSRPSQSAPRIPSTGAQTFDRPFPPRWRAMRSPRCAARSLPLRALRSGAACSPRSPVMHVAAHVDRWREGRDSPHVVANHRHGVVWARGGTTQGRPTPRPRTAGRFGRQWPGCIGLGA